MSRGKKKQQISRRHGGASARVRKTMRKNRVVGALAMRGSRRARFVVSLLAVWAAAGLTTTTAIARTGTENIFPVAQVPYVSAQEMEAAGKIRLDPRALVGTAPVEESRAFAPTIASALLPEVDPKEMHEAGVEGEELAYSYGREADGEVQKPGLAIGGDKREEGEAPEKDQARPAGGEIASVPSPEEKKDLQTMGLPGSTPPPVGDTAPSAPTETADEPEIAAVPPASNVPSGGAQQRPEGKKEVPTPAQDKTRGEVPSAPEGTTTQAERSAPQAPPTRSPLTEEGGAPAQQPPAGVAPETEPAPEPSGAPQPAPATAPGAGSPGGASAPQPAPVAEQPTPIAEEDPGDGFGSEPTPSPEQAPAPEAGPVPEQAPAPEQAPVPQGDGSPGPSPAGEAGTPGGEQAPTQPVPAPGPDAPRGGSETPGAEDDYEAAPPEQYDGENFGVQPPGDGTEGSPNSQAPDSPPARDEAPEAVPAQPPAGGPPQQDDGENPGSSRRGGGEAGPAAQGPVEDGGEGFGLGNGQVEQPPQSPGSAPEAPTEQPPTQKGSDGLDNLGIPGEEAPDAPKPEPQGQPTEQPPAQPTEQPPTQPTGEETRQPQTPETQEQPVQPPSAGVDQPESPDGEAPQPQPRRGSAEEAPRAQTPSAGQPTAHPPSAEGQQPESPRAEGQQPPAPKPQEERPADPASGGAQRPEPPTPEAGERPQSAPEPTGEPPVPSTGSAPQEEPKSPPQDGPSGVASPPGGNGGPKPENAPAPAAASQPEQPAPQEQAPAPAQEPAPQPTPQPTPDAPAQNPNAARPDGDNETAAPKDSPAPEARRAEPQEPVTRPAPSSGQAPRSSSEQTPEANKQPNEPEVSQRGNSQNRVVKSNDAGSDKANTGGGRNVPVSYREGDANDASSKPAVAPGESSTSAENAQALDQAPKVDSPHLMMVTEEDGTSDLTRLAPGAAPEPIANDLPSREAAFEMALDEGAVVPGAGASQKEPDLPAAPVAAPAAPENIQADPEPMADTGQVPGGAVLEDQDNVGWDYGPAEPTDTGGHVPIVGGAGGTQYEAAEPASWDEIPGEDWSLGTGSLEYPVDEGQVASDTPEVLPSSDLGVQDPGSYTEDAVLPLQQPQNAAVNDAGYDQAQQKEDHIQPDFVPAATPDSGQGGWDYSQYGGQPDQHIQPLGGSEVAQPEPSGYSEPAVVEEAQPMDTGVSEGYPQDDLLKTSYDDVPLQQAGGVAEEPSGQSWDPSAWDGWSSGGESSALPAVAEEPTSYEIGAQEEQSTGIDPGVSAPSDGSSSWQSAPDLSGWGDDDAPLETVAPEAAPSEFGYFDDGSSDAGLSEGGSFDDGSSDAGLSGGDSFDAAPADAGSSDAGSFDDGSSDAGLSDGATGGGGSSSEGADLGNLDSGGLKGGDSQE